MSAIQYLLAGDLVHIKKFAKDGAGRMEYIGYATPGTDDGEAKWFIKRLSYDAGGFQVDELMAGGNASFDKVWTAKATYTYS
jgi:hypothetical protein